MFFIKKNKWTIGYVNYILKLLPKNEIQHVI